MSQSLFNNTILNYQTIANMTSYATQSWVMSQNYLTVANMASYTTQAWVTSQKYLFSAVICNYLPLTGGIITDTVYNNTPLKQYFTANSTANSYSQDYEAITTTNGSYGGSIAGGIQQMVGDILL